MKPVYKELKITLITISSDYLEIGFLLQCNLSPKAVILRKLLLFSIVFKIQFQS
jgi:hypothetical protein